jgi:hypothetical protein
LKTILISYTIDAFYLLFTLEMLICIYFAAIQIIIITTRKKKQLTKRLNEKWNKYWKSIVTFLMVGSIKSDGVFILFLFHK